MEESIKQAKKILKVHQLLQVIQTLKKLTVIKITKGLCLTSLNMEKRQTIVSRPFNV
jgi:hypothetical protein